MKYIALMLAMLAAFPLHAKPAGYIAYFYVDKNAESDGEVSSDFYHFYNKAQGSFTKKGFEVLLLEKDPIKVKKPGIDIELSVKDIGINLGILFIKPNGEYKIFRGVGTGIDVLLSAEEYFGIKMIGE